MDRLTRRMEDGSWAADCDVQTLINRLAAFENMRDTLIAQRDKAASDMAALKAQGRSKSVTFRQLMAEKMNLTGIIQRMDFWLDG